MILRVRTNQASFSSDYQTLGGAPLLINSSFTVGLAATALSNIRLLLCTSLAHRVVCEIVYHRDVSPINIIVRDNGGAVLLRPSW